MTYATMVGLGGAIMWGATWLGTRWEQRLGNLVRNPGFDDGLKHWGPGYLEDAVRNGNHNEEVALLPYVVSPSPARTNSRGAHDSSVVLPGSTGSFRFDHRQPRQDHHFGSLAQRIHGLSPHTPYVLKFFAKASPETEPGAFLVTTDLRWATSKKPRLTEQ
jgi:hypothetical protein